ncbi:MAG: thiamine pyrophosphate-binding protein, partial [Gaiellaceae bacterium]
MAQRVKARTGGSLVAESLEAVGAEVAFGVPGIHALPIWEGLRKSLVRAVGLRTELDAGFAADGYARASGRPAPLLLSTGPGALISLAALMEAASAHVPVVAIASQIPSDLIGRGRGFLHELPDQQASFSPVVKWTAQAATPADIPGLVAEAWRRSLTPPSGPVFLEIPVDVLAGGTDAARVGELDTTPPEPALPPVEALDEAARLLTEAERPVVWAGGGVLRAGAWEELRALAERLGAPVATTYMGKGAFPEDHPLSAGSGCDEAGYRELVGGADVLLAVGTELGAETTGQYELRLSGRLIHVDAAPERIGATYPALGLVGDARAVLAALLDPLGDARSREEGERAVAELRARVAA